jgi:hypothetical protein
VTPMMVKVGPPMMQCHRGTGSNAAYDISALRVRQQEAAGPSPSRPLVSPATGRFPRPHVGQVRESNAALLVEVHGPVPAMPATATQGKGEGIDRRDRRVGYGLVK